MRLRVVDVTGTPEELNEAQALIELLRGSDGSPLVDSDEAIRPEETPPAWSMAIPEEIRQFIQSRSTGADRQRHVMRFVGEVLLWGNTEVEAGRSRRRADGLSSYLMLRKTGPRHFGAFVYVKPSTGGATFRLLKSEVETNEFVIMRDVRNANAYQVNCPLRSSAAVDQALKLARQALGKIAGR